MSLFLYLTNQPRLTTHLPHPPPALAPMLS